MNASCAATDEVLVARSEEHHDAFTAELMARAIYEAVVERGVARIAISGGTTPLGAYRRLAELDLPWDVTEWFWVDERAVARDHPRSNYRAAGEALRIVAAAGARASVPPSRVHRMEADDADREAAAHRYEAELRRAFGVASAVAFDVLTLGVGDDGHTASLFPRTGAVFIDDRLIAAIAEQPSRGLEARLTLTAPVIQKARLAIVHCRGEAKRGPVRLARSPGDPDEIPARILQRSEGRVVWVLDEAAAG